MIGNIDERGIQEMATAVIVALYTLASLVYHQIATFSFTHFDFSMGKSLFSIGGIGVSTAALLSLALPAVVYLVNDNEPMETTTQTYVAALPVGLAGVMLLSPPLMSFVTGSAFLSLVVFGVSVVSVGIVAGPNDFPEL